MNTTGGVVTAIALALVAWFLGGRSKSNADTTEKITAAAGDMLEQLRQEVQRLVLKVDNLEHENDRLRARVAELEREVHKLEGDGR